MLIFHLLTILTLSHILYNISLYSGPLIEHLKFCTFAFSKEDPRLLMLILHLLIILILCHILYDISLHSVPPIEHLKSLYNLVALECIEYLDLWASTNKLGINLSTWDAHTHSSSPTRYMYRVWPLRPHHTTTLLWILLRFTFKLFCLDFIK